MDAYQRNKELLRNFLDEVWSGGNAEACDLYLAESYTIHHDPGDPWDGQRLDLNGFKDRVRRSRAPFPDQRFDIQEMLADGDEVAATWLWSATHRGDIPGFPATGKVLRMSGATIYYFNNGGRISGHWQITDRLSIYQQLNQPG